MSRTRLIYNSQDLYVGAPYLTGDFLFYNSQFLQRINRVKGFSFDVSSQRIDVTELGTRSVVASPMIAPPRVEFSFNYCLNNVENDARIGLDVNYNTGGQPIYPDNYSISLISGFADKSRNFDRRNYYLAVNTTPNDTLDEKIWTTTYADVNPSGCISGILLHSGATGFNVVCFVNSYLTQYTTRATVGDFIHSEVSYVADSLTIVATGQGFMLPIFNTQTAAFDPSDVRVYLPNTFVDNQPSVLLPGDITISLSTPSNPNFPLQFNDFKISDYSIEIPLNRVEVQSIGHKVPLDRPIRFPVTATVSFGGLIGDLSSGHLTRLFDSDDDYNFVISVMNRSGQYVALRYDIKGAKFNGYSNETSIGSNSSASLSFRVELNPDILTTGIFVSGTAETRLVSFGWAVEPWDTACAPDLWCTTCGTELFSTEPFYFGPRTF